MFPSETSDWDIKIKETPSPSSYAVAQHIENLSRRIITHIRDRNWTHPDWEECLGDNFQAYAPNAFLIQVNPPTTASREEYLASYKAFTRDNPDYDVELNRIDVQVDERQGVARVWAIFTVTGHPLGVLREAVALFHWVRKGDRWTAVKQIGMRGVPGL